MAARLSTQSAERCLTTKQNKTVSQTNSSKVKQTNINFF